MPDGVSARLCVRFNKWILKACLGDETIMALSTQAVTPPEGLWDQVAAFYGENRPGWYYRWFPGKIRTLPEVGE